MKIYDCFTFYNELDLLELRFRLLYNLVDYFVLVEADKTQTGYDKPYYFEENKERYAEYADKIIHIKVDDMPLKHPRNRMKDGIWENEIFQRNCIMRGLVNCAPEDVVFISDLDEIPKPETIQYIFSSDSGKVKLLHKDYPISYRIHQHLFYKVNNSLLLRNRKKLNSMPFYELLKKTPVALEGETFYYFMNWRVENAYDACLGPIMCKCSEMLMPNKLRQNKWWYPYISKADYHFSYMGGAKTILKKLANTADYRDESEVITESMIEESLNQGIDIVNNKRIEKMDIDYFDGTIQKFISEHPELYRG